MENAGIRKLFPGSWPIAFKLAAALALASLLPMLIVSYISLQRSIGVTAERESGELEQLASSTGARIDQLISDTRHTISYLGWGQEVMRLASAPDPDGRRQVEDKMARLMTANQDAELFMVLDAAGRVLASTKPQYVGRDLSFRDYYKAAIHGRDFISDMEVGTASGQPGMYFSAPVRNLSGLVAGVAVMKLKGHAVTSILEDARSREPWLDTFLVDGDGIIIYHPQKKALYHSLVPLSHDLEKKLIDEKRFGLDVSRIGSYDLKALADKMLNARFPDHVRYFSPISNTTEIAGFAPLGEKRWQVGVSESEAVYSRPLEDLFRSVGTSVAAIGAIFVALGFLFARTFTRPLRALTASASAVERGDLDGASVPVTTRDELGRFAITFNAMIDGIKARQRERDIFGRMVSPEVREKLLTGELKLGGENLRVSVLFSDIRGFSTMSERMSPHDVVMLLNEYLKEMTEAVRPWGGYVNNFIGDAIVVVFGAPEACAGSEANAIHAAVAMKERLEQLNERRRALDDPPLVTGIGISTGKVVAGQIGSLERFMYTVIGDAVNVAARLEDLTKQFEGNPILVNGATYEGCRRQADDIAFVDKGLQRVKGREDAVHVYAVYAERASADGENKLDMVQIH